VAIDVPSLEGMRVVGMEEESAGRTGEWHRNPVDVQRKNAAQFIERIFARLNMNVATVTSEL
jgi:hypothetical protein